MKKILLLYGMLILVSVTQAQDFVKLSDYGYVPGSRQNAVPYVKRALEDCKKKNNPVLVFPKGRYDFWPQHATEKLYYESNTDVIPLRRCPIFIEGFKKLVVEGNKSDFIFHDRLQPFTIDSCQNVTIKNVNIDWDIPMVAQGQIQEVTDSHIDILINAFESPYIIENEKLVFVGEGWKSRLWGVMQFEKDTKLISPQTGDAGCMGENFSKYRAIELSKGLVRLQYAGKGKPKTGNWLVLRHSARDHAGTFIINSKDVVIENMNMYQNAGLGILAQYSTDLSFKNVHIIPNPAKNRILSGHDDGMQISSCRGEVVIDSCRFMALMDDPINVHGTSVKIIRKINARKLLCRFMQSQSIGFIWARPGEEVGFVENEAMNTLGRGRVNAFHLNNPEEFEITFSSDIPKEVREGNALENLSFIPNLHIKNSFFGSNRARGILVTTPGRVVIENNVFESSGSAILISGDANGWYESGAVKDVTIRNNTFNDSCLTSMYQFCEGIISISPVIPKPEAAKPFHRNIRIEDNTFHPFDYPVLYAFSTDGLTFTNNKIIRSTRFAPFHKTKYMFKFDYCKKIVVSKNIMEGNVLGKNIALTNTPQSELKLDKKQKLTVF